MRPGMTCESSRSLAEECVNERKGTQEHACANVQVVVWAIYVRRDRGGKVRTKLLLVRVVRDID